MNDRDQQDLHDQVVHNAAQHIVMSALAQKFLMDAAFNLVADNHDGIYQGCLHRLVDATRDLAVIIDNQAQEVDRRHDVGIPF